MLVLLRPAVVLVVCAIVLSGCASALGERFGAEKTTGEPSARTSEEAKGKGEKGKTPSPDAASPDEGEMPAPDEEEPAPGGEESVADDETLAEGTASIAQKDTPSANAPGEAPPAAQENLPLPGASPALLRDGNPLQKRVRESRSKVYTEGAKLGSNGVLTLTFIGSVSSVAVNPVGNEIGIDPTDPFGSFGDAPDMRHETVDLPEEMGKVSQNFYLLGKGPYRITGEVVEGPPPRVVGVGYVTNEREVGIAVFHIGFLYTQRGDRVRMNVRRDLPLDALRLEIDRDGDGVFEESWMPESTISSFEALDGGLPRTEMEEAVGEEAGLPEDRALVRLIPSDPAPGGNSPIAANSAGIGATYFTVDDGPPRMYATPFEVPLGAKLDFWSVDRAGNIELPRSVVVGNGGEQGGVHTV